jgi:multicomponent Na+:H+ antiporter subunit E
MTPKKKTRNEGVRWRIRRQLPLLVALVLLWMLLWGSFSWLNLATGIILAVVVTNGLYLPPVELAGRFNPLWFAVFLGTFLSELVVASFQVAFRAFARDPVRTNAVVAVQLRTRSDFIMTITAIALSLIPGSLIVEVDRDRSILYLHALGTRNQADIDKVRNDVLTVEGRLVRALGSTDDVRRLDA